MAIPVGFGHAAVAAAEVPAVTRRTPAYDAISASLARSAVAIAVAESPASERGALPSRFPLPAILDVGQPAPDRMVRPRLPADPARPVLAADAVGVSVARAGRPAAVAPAAISTAGGSAGGSAAGSAASDPCAPARASVDDRCGAVPGEREQARVAADAMRDAQRRFDILHERVDRAREASDPETIAVAKAAYQSRFRVDTEAAVTPAKAEAAKNRWLSAINRVNSDARAALRVVEAGTADLREQLPALERLAVEADAARIRAERAEAACREAREVLADCEEQAAAAAVPTPEDDDPLGSAWPTQHDPVPFRSDASLSADSLSAQPAFIRVLCGDRAARDGIVAALAGSEAAASAIWHLRIAALVDAVFARAIEAGYLVLPDDDPFWGAFTDHERREIVGALGSLGFRFDGLGGFADGRIPAARDLSLAVGYAGLDRMRIRIWPRDPEIGNLYARASVNAHEWLADRADNLRLGTVLDALGPRSADLGEIWNAWGRVRPALLASG